MKRTWMPWAVAALVAAGANAAEPAKKEVHQQAEPAPAGGCAGVMDRGLFDGPVALGFFSADYATGRRACPRSELGVGFLAGATVDTPDFYGALSGGALLYGSYAVLQPLELFGSLEAVKVAYVQNASLKGTSFYLGQATVGATYQVYRQGGLVVSPSARLMLPTDFSMPDVRTVGLELGAAASWRPMERLEVHGYAGGDVSAGISAAGALPRPGLLASAGVQYSVFNWGGVVLDINAHAGQAAYVAPALALRFAIARVVGLELGAAVPLAGTIRNNGAVGLKLSYRM